jgi:hypothetical protein
MLKLIYNEPDAPLLQKIVINAMGLFLWIFWIYMGWQMLNGTFTTCRQNGHTEEQWCNGY